MPNNLRYAAIQPAGIALCADAHDVQTSIRWAREYDVQLVARSGGHSYAGYSTTTGLMIDVSRMTSVDFDRSTGVVKLGGGARNKQVFEDFRPLSVAITHGRCLSVGVAGLTLGGGVGFNMRAHGLTCDQLLATEIVTADGVIHTVDATDPTGLYWACQGAGGGNFGINTSFTFQTFEVGTLTAYDIEWVNQPDQIFAALASLFERAPNTLACKLSASVAGKAPGTITVQLLGQSNGSKAELLEMLQPIYAIAAPSKNRVIETNYWNAQDFLSEEGEPAYYQERSRFFDEFVSHDAVATAFARLRRWPATVQSATFKLFQTGGKVNAVSPAETAFVHRNSHWLSSIAITWDKSTTSDTLQSNLDWQAAFYEAIIPLAKGGAYQNFIDPSLEDWRAAYYGGNLSRLETIKKHVDPTHVFNFPEAIP